MTSPTGLLPAQAIRRLIDDGSIGVDAPVVDKQIQPASLDLRLGARAWRIRASFLPGAGATVADRLSDFAMHEMDLSRGAVLETGCVYLVPLMEHLALPEGLSAAANAKSSIGRLDVFTRLICDGGTEFDRVEPGYHGPLYAEISPRTFSVLARTGSRLSQIRFRRGAPVLSDTDLAALHARERLVDTVPNIDHGLGFSVDLHPAPGRPAAWRARRHAGLIDLDRIGAYRASAFWDVLPGGDGRLILDPGAFYILASREAVHVPPSYAAEMTPYSALIGEFRVHYAGFFDPGFGHAPAGGSGARGVLEVRCHEVPFVLEHGQIVGRLVYEPMADLPEVVYGTALGSTYQAQGLKLSKHFVEG